MSWDASDEETWERWERARLQSRLKRYEEHAKWLPACAEKSIIQHLLAIVRAYEAGARVVGGGAVDGETEPAAVHAEGKQPASTSKDPESLNPVFGLYDRLPHEED